MAKIYTEEEITVNMNDAGFSDMEIRDFLKLMKQGNEKQAYRIDCDFFFRIHLCHHLTAFSTLFFLSMALLYAPHFLL